MELVLQPFRLAYKWLVPDSLHTVLSHRVGGPVLLTASVHLAMNCPNTLVQEVVRWARSIGSTVVRLDVSDGNDAAAQMYLRNGFAYTGELGDLMADGVRRERVMSKSLPG